MRSIGTASGQTIRERAARAPARRAGGLRAGTAGRRSELSSSPKEANASGLELTELALARDPRSSAALLHPRPAVPPAGRTRASGRPPRPWRGWGEAVRKLVDLDPELRLGSPGPRCLVRATANKKRRTGPGRARPRAGAGAEQPADPAPQVAEQLPWRVSRSARPSCSIGRCASIPGLRFDWRQYQVGFFLGRFREAVDLIEGFNDTGRWDHLFATLGHAQLGDAAKTADWRARLVESWPDFSWELSVSETATFPLPPGRARALAGQPRQGGPADLRHARAGRRR